MSGLKIRGIAARLLPVAAAVLVCLCQAHAQTGAAANVVNLIGQVSVLRDGAPWALKAGDSIQPLQVIVTGPDGFAEFKVADGSSFQVFPNSRVHFRANAFNWKDLLDLLVGRVKVQIHHFANQPNPNSVRTPTAVISVRGTVFDVVVEDDTDATLVSVDEGQVEVANLTSPGPSKILNPGDTIRVIKNQPLAKVVDKGSVARSTMRAAAEAIYELIYRTSRSGSSAGGTTIPGCASCDKNKPEPPTTAPPPPPPQ